MLVRHRGGNRVMSWREFGACLGRHRFSSTALPRMLGWTTQFVGPVAGRATDGCLKLVMLGKATEFVGPGADGRRLLERCSNRTQDKCAIVSMAKEVSALFHRRVHARMQVHLLRGHTVYRLMVCPLWRGGAWMWVLMWYALFSEVVRGCGC